MEEYFKIDLSVFSAEELNVLLKTKTDKNKVLTKEELAFINRFNKEHERQKNEYYKNIEAIRKGKLKKGDKIVDKRIDLLELHSKKTLVSDLLRYENRDKYIKEHKNFINKFFIDRLKGYLKLIDNEFINKSYEEIIQYKDISDLFINSIYKKVIDDYNKGLDVKKTLLPFLYLNEYMK